MGFGGVGRDDWPEEGGRHGKASRGPLGIWSAGGNGGVIALVEAFRRKEQLVRQTIVNVC